jgi:hypothetical protein
VRVLIDVGHPAHVHFFRPAIAQLHERGHEVRITARAKDVTLELLDGFRLPYRVLSRAADHHAGLYLEWLVRTARLVKALRGFAADVTAAVGGAFVAPAGRIARVPSLVFTDTEHVRIDRLLTFPLATRICVPYSFRTEVSGPITRYNGLHELAYLSPSRFRPEPGVLSAAGAAPPYAVVRFVSWGASHDRGHRGLAALGRDEVLRRLGRLCPIIVSDEGSRLAWSDGRALEIAPHHVHHVLARASLYIGEGATMATEAGLLGTPSVYVSSLVGTMGNFDLLAEAGLVESFVDPAAALDRAEALLVAGDARREWERRAREFGARHVDVTAFIVEQLEELGGRRQSRRRR